MVPPSHAPVTSCERPRYFAIYGISIIIGIAVISTNDIMYDNFLESPLMAPDVAIAADTPHIETALDSIIDNSSSTFNFLHTHQAKYHTDITTNHACIRPSVPAFRISPKSTLVPSGAKPSLTNSEVDNEERNPPGILAKLLISNP